MTWFYNLRRLVRNVIVGALWGILAVVAGVIGGVYEWQTDNVPAALAVLILVLLAAAIVFTVFAVKATKKEKAAAQTKGNDAQTVVEKKRTVPPSDRSVTPVEREPAAGGDVVGIHARIINSGCNLPIHTKAVGVTFDDCQTNLAESQVGDALIIKHAPNGRWIESTDIINARTGNRVGRIQKELAFALLDEFNEGFVLDGEILDLTGGTEDAPTRGCNIIITGAHV